MDSISNRSNPWRAALVAGAMLLAGAYDPAAAEWIAPGTVVTNAVNNQFFADVAPDGEGGVIVAWQDERFDGVEDDIYAQRMDADGNALWADDGIPVCTAAGDQRQVVVAPDGFGGVVMAWTDYRDGNQQIYAQRLDAAGTPLWTANGFPLVFIGNGIQFTPQIAPDGQGGAIITWSATLFDPQGDVYAQKLDANGFRAWPASGVAVANQAGVAEARPDMVGDGAGGAYIFWQDDRFGDLDVFGQHLDATGANTWANGGFDFSNGIGTHETVPKVVLGPQGDGFVVFRDDGAGDEDLFAVRFMPNGVTVWSGPRPVVQAAGDQHLHDLLVSDAGDLVLVWRDIRVLPFENYAQRLAASDGAPLWAYDGILMSIPGSGEKACLVTDGNDGVIAAWSTVSGAIVTQRVSPAGERMWGSGGSTIVEDGFVADVQGIASDRTGGAVAVWSDNRSGWYDILAQRIEPRRGLWGYPEPRIASVADVPGDQGGVARVSWTASDHDAIPYETITHYSLWRATDATTARARTAAAGAASAAQPIRLVALEDVTRGFKGPAYRASADGYYWEYVGEQQSIYAPAYSFATATEADSSSATEALHYFQVVSHASAPFMTFPSDPDSGYSVDNLSPPPPGMLNAQRAGGTNVDLVWAPIGEETPDFGTYAIYRSESAGVPIDEEHFIASTPDSMYIDPGADPQGEYHYVVVALDVHENASDPSNEAMVGRTSGVETAPGAIARLSVRPNLPNPFVNATSLTVGLPAAGDVHLVVYDVTGRRVATRRYAGLDAGWHRLRFDGRRDAGGRLPPGVYFYDVSTRGETRTQRMIIAR